MRFVFNGTVEELKHTIQEKAKELGKDIIVYHNSPNTLEIGCRRLGHTGGRFFLANITESDSHIVLNGELADVYSGKPETGVHAIFHFLPDLPNFMC